MIHLPIQAPATRPEIDAESLAKAHLRATVDEAISAVTRALSETRHYAAPVPFPVQCALDHLHIAASRLDVTAALLR